MSLKANGFSATSTQTPTAGRQPGQRVVRGPPARALNSRAASDLAARHTHHGRNTRRRHDAQSSSLSNAATKMLGRLLPLFFNIAPAEPSQSGPGERAMHPAQS